MKYILLMLIFVLPTLTYSQCQTSAHGQTTLTATINHNPITVRNMYRQRSIPDVYKGEIATVPVFITFNMTKDALYDAQVDMVIPSYPVHGVRLIGRWWYVPFTTLDEYTSESQLQQGHQISPNGYLWDENWPWASLVLQIDQIDALTGGQSVQTGIAEFVIQVSADYINL